MTLLPLTLSFSLDELAAIAATDALDRVGDCCSFCGGAIGVRYCDTVGEPSCVLCGLARHLERPRIDDEARLIWLPEMSQAGLNVLIREMHCRLRALGERLHLDSRPTVATDDRICVYHAQQALLARGEAAAARLDSALPSDLADALVRLSPSAYRCRARLLSGIRLLPAGRFFDGEDDIYPEIVDSWRATGAGVADAAAAGAA